MTVSMLLSYTRAVDSRSTVTGLNGCRLAWLKAMRPSCPVFPDLRD